MTSSRTTADVEHLTRQALFTGYQYFSLFTPLAYTAFVVRKRGNTTLTINNVLRTTWIGGIAGSVCVGGLAYLRYSNASNESVKAKRMENTYDISRIQANDSATIGAVLGAVLLPAILWKRAHIVNLTLGGASIGTAMGLATHQCRSLLGISGTSRT